MNKEYDKYLQKEAEEWFEDYDEATTDGLLKDLTGEPFEEDDEIELYKSTGIF